ncbi:hypothetical protein B0T11DRAFT_282384 [Plectosphaerella cucumerina]|uniref:Zn(2)-C6 fungal-type domain-containing protein n=1 Tax=Plectosphaerella cucumerina TaxID=40658 RepID=A0A8K0X4K6_9PEZI|nr:hypothetical protein B0T11DRAFT_282384 [Plectosphaerella cucumerina]
MRPRKTDIVRKRTGCQRCRNKRRQCDETRPECLACVQRGVPCSGYERSIRFKDVSDRTAEASKRVEAARWSALRSEDGTRSRGRDGADAVAGATGHFIGAGSLFPDEHANSTRPPGDGTTLQPGLSGRLQTLSAEEDGEDDGNGYVFPLAPFAPVSQCEFVAGAMADARWPLQARPLAEVQDMLVTWNDPQPQQQVSPSWDDLVYYPDPSRAPSRAPSRVPSRAQSAHSTPRPNQVTVVAATEPTSQAELMTEEALLSIFINDIAPHLSLQLPYAQLCNASSGFRAAVLALAVAAASHGSNGGSPGVEAPCHYYDFAVADLSHQLRRPRPEAGDALLGTVMLLIHRELVAGSYQGVRARLRQLEDMARVVDFSNQCSPSLLRAWRMLSFEMRLCSLPTRKTIAGPPPPHTATPWDAQMTIRDIFSSLWRLHSRAIIEASFPEESAPLGAASAYSASRKAAQWLCLVLGRKCDRSNWEQQDFHDQSLTRDAIMGQATMFEERLDIWHRSIGRDDVPVPCIDGGAEDILSLPLGGAIIPYDVPDSGKATDYALYLLSRMMCMYIVASYGSRDTSTVAVPGCAARADAMARIVLGIGLKKGPSPPRALSEPDSMSLAFIATLLTEGVSIATAILEGLLPALRAKATLGPAQAVEQRVERAVELVLRERHAGRSVRFIINGYDEDEKANAVLEAGGPTKHVIFGDIGGRGYFRDVVTMGG